MPYLIFFMHGLSTNAWHAGGASEEFIKCPTGFTCTGIGGQLNCIDLDQNATIMHGTRDNSMVACIQLG